MVSSEEEDYEVLFETKKFQGRYIYRLFSVTIFICICCIWFYRLVINIQTTYDYSSYVVNIGMLLCEFWFGFYWILTQSFRWNQVYRRTFKHALSRRYKAEELPGVDIFVCTADPATEPPIIVVNTVLSVMSYDYPLDKLTVYLSDDAGSDLTFYALLQASSFANHWLPFCKKHKIEPRSPAAFFESNNDSFLTFPCPQDLALVQRLYDEMKTRIDNAGQLGHISDEIRSTHTGFSQWNSTCSQRDHDTVLQIVSDGRDRDLPTLVYLAREKRPQHFHNYKAGSMNALLRVSSEISNGDIVLNVDCDMYSNNSESIRDSLCFFMDEKQGQQIAYVQFPQNFNNITNNDLYASALRTISEVDMHGLDGYGGPLYIGTGCFHRRDTLCGRKYNKEDKFEWNRHNSTRSTQVEDTVKLLASSSYDHNTLWGKEMGLRYGVPVEDVITGLSIQSQGWKSVYFNPERRGFLGIAPTTLTQSLVQHKRWSEGDFQILLSSYSPAWYGTGKINPGLQLGYCAYCLWAPNSLATLYYATIPALSLLHGISVFPKISSPWFLPFAYVIVAKYGYSLSEFLWSGGTVLGWWHDQRMWLYKRTSSYLFAFIDTILKKLGFSESRFIITDKVTDEDVSQRYAQEMMEFGKSCSMFTMLAIVALLNMYCFIGAVVVGLTTWFFEEMGLQVFVCGIIVLINWPLYKAMFIRKDNGKMPVSLTIEASVIIFALFASTWFSPWKQ